MKSRLPLLLVLPVLFITACASTGFLMAKPKVTVYGNVYPSKIDDKIDVYNTSRPNVEYIEIAQISCGDTDDEWNMKQIQMKAREMGADGIMITGRSGSYGVGVPIGNMSYATAEGYGITAIAIKYK
jgi:hypothetical protein